MRGDAEPKYRQLEPPARANAVNVVAPRATGRVNLLERAVDEQVNLANCSERGVERGLAFRTSELGSVPVKTEEPRRIEIPGRQASTRGSSACVDDSGVEGGGEHAVPDEPARRALGIESRRVADAVPMGVEEVDLRGAPREQRQRLAHEQATGRTINAKVAFSHVRTLGKERSVVLVFDVGPNRDVSPDRGVLGQLPPETEGDDVAEKPARTRLALMSP